MSKAALRSEDQILDELAEVGQAIAAHEASLEQLYPRRLALFQEAKAGHATVNRILGERAGVEETAVIAAFRKAKEKAAKSTGAKR